MSVQSKISSLLVQYEPIYTNQLGVADGVATLDGTGKVPTSQLPVAILGALIYKGTWNANTNTPSLSSGVGTKGDYYVVNVAGTTNLDGITDWQIGDWVVFNGTVWEKIDNTDVVTSVNGAVGAVSIGLPSVLAQDAQTSGNDIIVESGDKITWQNGTFGGSIVEATLTAHRTYQLPNASGTIALTSDIPALQGLASVLGVSNSTGANDISVANNQSILLDDNGAGSGGSFVKWNANNYIVYDDQDEAKMQIVGNSGGVELISGTNAMSVFNDILAFATGNANIPIIRLGNTSGFSADITHLSLTDDRTWSFPNRSGEVALVSDFQTAQAYTVTGLTTARAFDASTVTHRELADIVGTIITDLQSVNILSS